jgi:hypothetical protein
MSYPYQIKSMDAYHAAYKKSIEEPAQFWSEIAEHFTWHKKWDTTLEWNFKDPKVEWFKGGQLNITENCLYINVKIRDISFYDFHINHSEKLEIFSLGYNCAKNILT